MTFPFGAPSSSSSAREGHCAEEFSKHPGPMEEDFSPPHWGRTVIAASVPRNVKGAMYFQRPALRFSHSRDKILSKREREVPTGWANAIRR